MIVTEIAQHFGSDTTTGGLARHFQRNIKADVDLLRACVKGGQDPKDLVLAQVKAANGGKGANGVIADFFYSTFSLLLSTVEQPY